jgi:hypothetical protein
MLDDLVCTAAPIGRVRTPSAGGQPGRRRVRARRQTHPETTPNSTAGRVRDRRLEALANSACAKRRRTSFGRRDVPPGRIKNGGSGAVQIIAMA